MVSEISEYKGHKMIVLKEREDSEYPFSFGLKKAKLILEHITDIERFVEENG